MRRRIWWATGLVLTLVTLAYAQQIPPQVLALLTRANTWGAVQTFANTIKFNTFVPSVTTRTVWTDGTNLFWGNTALSGGGSVLTPHNLLSTAHPDTLPASVTRGAVVVGNATPAWASVTVGAAGTFLRSDGTDTTFGTDGSALTALTAANLTGALPAIAGANLTTLNASNLSAGTVPLARITGLTNTQIDAAAAIARSKLSLAAGIVMTTDIVGITPVANGGTNLSAAADDNLPVGNGTTWQTKAVPDCDAATSALNYDVTTNAFSCRTLSLGSGTVTSVALSLPAIITVSGSPVTTAGTLTGTLATQTANTLWSGPTTGAAATPTFRAMVNADIPVTGVAAGAYALVTVNTGGRVTAGVATLDAATLLTGIAPVANGGTGNATIGDDNIFIGSAATTLQPKALPNCVAASCWGIGYTTATNTLAAITAKTVIEPLWLDPGYCQNATVVLAWSTPTSQPAVGTCVTGSNTQRLVVAFANTTELSMQRQLRLPTDWTSTVDVNLVWYTSATSGAVVWQVATACVASLETGDPTFNAASTIASTAQGTTLQYNTAAITGLTMTGCAAGEVLYLRVYRDPADAGDTLAATANLVGLTLTLRRAL